MMHSLRRHLECGSALMAAYELVAQEFEVGARTVRRCWNDVRYADPADWLVLLLKSYQGRKPDEIDERVLAYFYSDYGRVDKPALQAVWERTVKQAEVNGWGKVPSPSTLERLWARLPLAQRKLMREGEEALGNVIPYAERDRSGMKPLDGVNSDGREWDIMVEWPDGHKAAPLSS